MVISIKSWKALRKKKIIMNEKVVDQHSAYIYSIAFPFFFFLSRQKFLREVVFSVVDGVLRRFLRYASYIFQRMPFFMTKGLMGMWQYYVFDIYPNKNLSIQQQIWKEKARMKICMLLQSFFFFSLSAFIQLVDTYVRQYGWSVIWANLNAVKFYECVKLLPFNMMK